MVCRKGEQAIDERKSTKRCQGFVETKRFEASTCKMDRGNVWVSKAAKGLQKIPSLFPDEFFPDKVLTLFETWKFYLTLHHEVFH